MSATKPRRGAGARNSTAAEKARDAVESSEGGVVAAPLEADRQAEGAALTDGDTSNTPTGGQDEPATEDRARMAEAVTPPGGSADEIAGAQVVATLEEADYTVTHLHVRALRDGFRRCGRAWPAAGVEVPAEDFSDEEITRLLNEPLLAVMPVCRPLPEIE
ncbi:MAG TPA: hypothetical protein PLN31_09575 [Azoarcus taiwanensis]|nr:hypothetical protein [Azoarcus taiwanensis]